MKLGSCRFLDVCFYKVSVINRVKFMIFNDQNPGPTKEIVTKILDLPYRNCNSGGNNN